MTFPLLKRKLIRGCAEHISAHLSCAADYEALSSMVYAPFGGRLYRFKEAKGGSWLGIKRENGDRVEFAHLDRILKSWWQTSCKEGEPVAISGNTGQVTTGPHLHLQVLDKNGQRLDPEKYFSPVSLPVVVVNAQGMQEFQKSISEYSQGMLTISWDIISKPITVETGDLKQFDSYEIIESIYHPKYLPFRFIFIFYNGPNAAFLKTYYYPKRNCVISTIPNQSPTRLQVFEFTHAIQVYYNTHRGSNPYLEVVDSNFPSDELITDKIRSVLPYTNILIKK